MFLKASALLIMLRSKMAQVMALYEFAAPVADLVALATPLVAPACCFKASVVPLVAACCSALDFLTSSASCKLALPVSSITTL